MEALSDCKVSICAMGEVGQGLSFGPGEHFKVPELLQVNCFTKKCEVAGVSCLSFMVLGACRCQSCRFPLGGTPTAELLCASRAGLQIQARSIQLPLVHLQLSPQEILCCENSPSRIAFLNSDNQSNIFNSRVLFQKPGDSPKKSSVDAALLNHKYFIQF